MDGSIDRYTWWEFQDFSTSKKICHSRIDWGDPWPLHSSPGRVGESFAQGRPGGVRARHRWWILGVGVPWSSRRPGVMVVNSGVCADGDGGFNREISSIYHLHKIFISSIYIIYLSSIKLGEMGQMFLIVPCIWGMSQLAMFDYLKKTGGLFHLDKWVKHGRIKWLLSHHSISTWLIASLVNHFVSLAILPSM